MLKDHSLLRTAAIAMLTLFTIGVALFISGDHVRTAQAASPVSEVFVSKTNGEVEKVIVSTGMHTVVASTGVGGADSLLFEPSGKLIVTGLGSPNIFRVDPNLPGGAANTPITPIPVNITPFPPFAADPALDGAGNVLVTDFSDGINVVNLTTRAVTHHTVGGLLDSSGISFDGAGQLWVTNRVYGTVGIANLTTNTYTPLCTLPGQAPDGLSFDPSTGKLYVSAPGNAFGTITELTIGTGTCAFVPTPYPGGSVYSVSSNCTNPDGIAADGDFNVFVACQNGTLDLLDTTTGTVDAIATGIPYLDDIAPVTGLGAPTGSITICKKTDPDPPVGNPVFAVDDSRGSRDLILHDNDCFTNPTPSPGPYNFSELPSLVPPGWALTNIVCTSGSSIGFFVDPNGFSLALFIQGDTGVRINWAPGENVTCTFTNTSVPCATSSGLDISTGTVGFPGDVDAIWHMIAGPPNGNTIAVPPFPAYVVSTYGANFSGFWVTPPSGSQWITYRSAPVGNPSGQFPNPPPPDTYTYDTAFCVNLHDCPNPQLTLQFASADYSALVKLNTTTLATNQPNSFPAFYQHLYTTNSTGFINGLNHLTFTVNFDSDYPTGLLVKGKVTADCPPVGGVVALSVPGSGASVPWTPLAAVAAAALAVLAVGGWYSRRRWLR